MIRSLHDDDRVEEILQSQEAFLMLQSLSVETRYNPSTLTMISQIYIAQLKLVNKFGNLNNKKLM